jgi:uncharacterized protein (TIGR02271 family)
MLQGTNMIVVDRNGLQGVAEAHHANAGRDEQVLVRFENDVRIVLPRELLHQQDDGRYYLDLTVAEYQAGDGLQVQQEMDRGAGEESTYVLPVTQEDLTVGKQRVETGSVKIHKSVQERVEVVDEALQSEEVDVERVTINRPIDEPPAVRHEGDILIIPLLEEVLFVEKRLVLREEIRIKKVQKEIRAPQQVTLRQEQVEIERKPGPSTRE